jgi:hypothetical protein
MLFMVVVILVLMVVGLGIVVLVQLNHRNRPAPQYGWPTPGQQQPEALPAGRSGTSSHCCRQDGPCSARCGQLEMAQTMLAASDGARHSEVLQPLIKLLYKVAPDTLHHLLDAEEAAPGTIGHVIAALQDTGPAGASPDRPSSGRRVPAA